MNKLNISKEALQSLYVEQGLSLKKVGEHFGVSLYVIRNRLIDCGLRRRAEGRPLKVGPTEAELRELYLDKNLSATDIAKSHGCTEATVRRLLTKYKIPRKPRASSVITKEF